MRSETLGFVRKRVEMSEERSGAITDRKSVV